MRISTFLLWALILFSVDTLSNISKSQEVVDENARMKAEHFSICRNGKHEELYDFGQELAAGWNLLKDEHKSGTYFPLPDTQKGFILHAYGGVEQKYSSMEEYEEGIKPCHLGYLIIPIRQAWSSVHSGFTDYLSTEDKVLFFSLPER